jgi:hypothetical protein
VAQVTTNLPADPSKVPRTIRKLGKAPVKSMNERVLMTTPEVMQERMSICKNCNSFEDWACKVTNNFMPKTVMMKGTVCPRGYWSTAYTGVKK